MWGTSDARPGKIVLVEEFLAPRMLPDTLWAKIVERRAFYGAGPLDAERFGVVGAQSAGVLEMAVDEGALGSMIAEQWRQPPYALPVTAAEKTAIEVQADFLSAAMNRGDVLISKFSVMAADMAVARWDEKKLREQHKRVEAKTPHSDIIPAGRYGFKKIHAIATSLRAPTAAPTVEQKESTELERERREGAEKARRLMEGRPVIGASRREAVDRWRR